MNINEYHPGPSNKSPAKPSNYNRNGYSPNLLDYEDGQFWPQFTEEEKAMREANKAYEQILRERAQGRGVLGGV
jgi:hypothetical protein